KALSQELGPSGIRLNAISPGPVGTDFWLGPQGAAATVGKATSGDPATARDQIGAAVGGIPPGRFPTPDADARPGAPLASPLAGPGTGANRVIAGGLIKTT